MSRREFLKKAGAAGAFAGAGYASLTSPSYASAQVKRVHESASAVSLTLWMNHPEWAVVTEKLLAEFKQQYPDISIIMTEKNGPAYPAILTAALAADSAPDMFGFDPGVAYIDAGRAGKLADLTGKVNVGALNAAAKAVVYVDNKVYGIPILGEYTTGMFYWVPTFDKYHLTPPKNWSDFTNICATLAKNGVTPLAMPSSDGILPSFFWTGLMTTVRGPSVIEDVATGKAKLTDPDLVAATKYVHSLAQYFGAGYESTAYALGKALFAEGKMAICEGGSADYTGYKVVNPSADVSFFAHPHPNTSGVPTVNSGTDFLYCLNANLEKDPAKLAAGVTFLNFFMTKKIGSQVAQQLEMPSINGAQVTSPVFRTIIEQSANNGVQWFEYPSLGAMWSYSLDNIAGMLVGNVTPDAFASAAQAQIKPS